VLVLFALSRLALFVMGLVTLAFDYAGKGYGFDLAWFASHPGAVWSAWDVSWYERIAMEGYGGPRAQDSGFSAWGFMPLYPLLTGAATRLLGGADAHAYFMVASVLSSLVTCTALVWLQRLYAPRLRHAGRLPVFYLLACGTFYLSIPYTESLFLLLIAAVIALTARRLYVPAALLAGLAVVTRVQGAALIAIPLIGYWLSERPRVGQGALITAVMLVLHFAPLGLFMAEAARQVGDPLAWLNVQSAWRNPDPYPLAALVGLADTSRGFGPYLHAYVWALYLVVMARNYRRLGPAELAFCLGVFLVSTSTEVFYGAYRYSLALAPVLAVLCDEQRWVRNWFLASNLALLPVYVFGFVTWRGYAI
jgi:hypothetical protein